MNTITIGFAGMSHLGLNSAAAAAEKGFRSICFDPDETIIRSLNAGELPISEPGFAELIARNKPRLHFTAKAGDLASCDVMYLCRDVSTDDKGVSDLGPVRALIDLMQNALHKTASLVVLSQVPPGFCRCLGLQPGQVFYQVETLIFGQAVERALKPERFIVGSADPELPLPAAYRTFLESFSCPILTMRYESAELAKIAINMILVSSISTTNMLAEICEGTGASWHVIAPALKLDRRIGPHAYLSPGLGIAGGNLERDLATLEALGNTLGTDVRVVQAWRDNSRHRANWVLNSLHNMRLVRPESVFAVLGLAYKEDTDSTKNSPAISLLSALAPCAVTTYDPVVVPEAAWHPRLKHATSAIDACNGADALIIMTPWPEFHKLHPREIAAKLKGNVVVDPFACLDRNACKQAELIHISLGTASGRPNIVPNALA